MKYKTRYKDSAEQNFYMNCCDCIIYGYGINTAQSCGEQKEKRISIWKRAFEDISSIEGINNTWIIKQQNNNC